MLRPRQLMTGLSKQSSHAPLPLPSPVQSSRVPASISEISTGTPPLPTTKCFLGSLIFFFSERKCLQWNHEMPLLRLKTGFIRSFNQKVILSGLSDSHHLHSSHLLRLQTFFTLCAWLLQLYCCCFLCWFTGVHAYKYVTRTVCKK